MGRELKTDSSIPYNRQQVEALTQSSLIRFGWKVELTETRDDGVFRNDNIQVLMDCW